MVKSNILLQFLGVLTLFSLGFCTEPTDNTKIAAVPTPSVKSVKIDTNYVKDFATAQIALNVETLSEKNLATANLDLFVVFNDTNKYKVNTFLVDAAEVGPFNNITITDKAIITKNDEIKLMITYELQAPYISWETQGGKLTGNYGKQPFKELVKSKGGSLTGVATLIFDAKTMNLKSQNSVVNQGLPANNNESSDSQQWYDFATKNLKIRLSTQINWTHSVAMNVPNEMRSSGILRENK